MFNEKFINKKNPEDKIMKTNCYVCGCELKLEEAKTNPDNEGDKRLFCPTHWKKRFGKKKRLIKRY